MTPEEIKNLRTALKMSQPKFAKFLHIRAISTISRWENGHTAPEGLYIDVLKRASEDLKLKTAIN